jgi:hypothetical protein
LSRGRRATDELRLGATYARRTGQESRPAAEPSNHQAQDGTSRSKRDNEGKRQHRNAGYLIHWRAPHRFLSEPQSPDFSPLDINLPAFFSDPGWPLVRHAVYHNSTRVPLHYS